MIDISAGTLLITRDRLDRIMECARYGKRVDGRYQDAVHSHAIPLPGAILRLCESQLMSQDEFLIMLCYTLIDCAQQEQDLKLQHAMTSCDPIIFTVPTSLPPKTGA